MIQFMSKKIVEEQARILKAAKERPMFGSDKCETIEELATLYGRVISPEYEDRMRSYLFLPPAKRG